MISIPSDCDTTGAITGRMSGLTLTLGNPKPKLMEKLGTEIKAVLQNTYNTEYKICSFDFPSQELIFAAVYNSAEYCRFQEIKPDALATEAGKFVLLGKSSEGTDAHSQLAKQFSITRSDSKTMGLSCLPESSQAYSKARGWVNGLSLEIGELVLGYNTKTDKLEYTPVEKVHSLKNQEVWASENHNRVLLSTKTHRWFTSLRNDTVNGFDFNSALFQTTAELQNSRSKVLHAAQLTPSEESLLTPNEARILTWLLTDGSWTVTLDKRSSGFKSVRGYIIQGKELYKQQIYKLLVEEKALSGVPVPVKSINLACYRYYVKSSYLKVLLEKCRQPLVSKKDFTFTSIINQLNAKAIKACAYVIIKAEGSWRPNNTGVRIAQNDTDYSDDIATILYLAGFMIKRNKASVNAYGNKVRNISAIKRRYSQVTYDKCYLHSVEDVWCITTPLSTFVTRQADGFITLLGNCLYGAGQTSICNLLRPTLGLRYSEKQLKAVVNDYVRYFKGTKERGDHLYQNGLFSHFFNYAQWLINQPIPRLKFGNQAITNTLRPEWCGNDYYTSRINWTVQATGSAILDAMCYEMDKRIFELGLEDYCWYQFSCHDQIAHICHQDFTDQWVEITRKAYKTVWTNFFKSFGMTCPQQVIDNLELTIDTIDRKAPDTDVKTVSGKDFLGEIPNGLLVL